MITAGNLTPSWDQVECLNLCLRNCLSLSLAISLSDIKHDAACVSKFVSPGLVVLSQFEIEKKKVQKREN